MAKATNAKKREHRDAQHRRNLVVRRRQEGRRSKSSPTTSGRCRRSASANSNRSRCTGRRCRARAFAITENCGGLPTAVMGEAGEGGPVIAILGEFDALPGLSQEAGVAERREIASGGAGHGCGHNLLGAGAMLAATAIKDYLAKNGLKGRVRYYGCPAEEGGSGKAFMVREGAFDDVDIAISWHPAPFMALNVANSLSMIQIDFTFRGRCLACGCGAPSRPQRARCGRTDERRRQLHARARAERRAHSLCHRRFRRHRAERGAGDGQRSATWCGRSSCRPCGAFSSG